MAFFSLRLHNFEFMASSGTVKTVTRYNCESFQINNIYTISLYRFSDYFVRVILIFSAME
jgi:hypothetical protein